MITPIDHPLELFENEEGHNAALRDLSAELEKL